MLQMPWFWAQIFQLSKSMNLWMQQSHDFMFHGILKICNICLTFLFFSSFFFFFFVFFFVFFVFVYFFTYVLFICFSLCLFSAFVSILISQNPKPIENSSHCIDKIYLYHNMEISNIKKCIFSMQFQCFFGTILWKLKFLLLLFVFWLWI